MVIAALCEDLALFAVVMLCWFGSGGIIFFLL
jgi:hypothetical protein